MSSSEKANEFTEDIVPARRATLPVFQEPFDEKRYRERTRALLAGALCAVLTIVLLIVVIRAVLIMRTTKEATELLGVVLAPLVGLVGAATGFYYGGKSN
jgi:hypothetical protein